MNIKTTTTKTQGGAQMLPHSATEGLKQNAIWDKVQ